MVGGNLGTPKIAGAVSSGSFALRRETAPHRYIYIYTHTPQVNICVILYIVLCFTERIELYLSKKKKKREENSEMAGERGKVEEEKNDYLGVRVKKKC